MALNIITAKFCSGSNQTWTKEVWQYDYGQVLLIEDVELPEAYEVHFSNMPIKGTAKPQIGNADGVTIPDEYFESGEPIYAWLFLHQGENDGETEKMITIPVKKRSKVVNEQPTPVEQSAITQAIAALNIAVEKAEDAIEHYPQIIDGTWHVWDVTEEEYVDTGVQAQGHDGEDGVSPGITVQDITNGHRVTITDATGTTTFDVMDGENGADGISPDVSIQNITNGHRVTITDAGGTHTFDVMNGSDATVTVDSALSTTSENPVQNKVINSALNGLVPKSATDAEIGSTTKIKNYGDLLKLSYSDSQGGVDVQLEGNNLLIYAKEGNSQNLLNFGANGTSIKNVVTPTSAGDAVPKSYVDTNVGAKADISDLAPAYSTSGTYAVGDYVTYTGNVYRCTTAITTAEAWTAAHWTQVTIGTELSQTNEDITDLQDALDGKVDDVQVNGTSVVSQGVANIPFATAGLVGVTKLANTFGLYSHSSYPEYARIYQASSPNIKEATNSNECQHRPITPYHQHESTFYGLAKAAGDTTQSASSNPVGTYTDAAKIAIQKMLGIYEAPWELLNNITLDTDSIIDLTADSNGTPYDLLGVYIYVLYPANATSMTTGYGRFRFEDTNNSLLAAETGRYATSSASKFKHIFLERINNLSVLSYTTQATTGNHGAWVVKPFGYGTGININFGHVVHIFNPTGDVEPAGTQIQIYGQRAC